MKIYSSIFDEKVSLVGDNAFYYILGNSIADGAGYKNIHHAAGEAHTHYPPGYPSLIATTIQLFSDDISTIKILNGVLFFGAILLLFFIVKKLSQNHHIAFATCFISLLNYHMLSYTTLMMSEMAFLFFSLLCIWFFFKTDFSKPVFKNKYFFAALICLSFSFYIRSVALALFVSLAIYMVFKKQWRYAFSLAGGFMLLYLPWIIRNRNLPKNSYLQQLSLKNPYQPELGTMGFSDFYERIILNLERYIAKEIPSGILHAKEMLYNEATTTLEWVIGLLVLSVILFGLFRLGKMKVFILLYLMSFSALLLLWPHVWYGTRFLIPIVPLLIFLVIFGLVEMFTLLSQKLFPRYKVYIAPIAMILILGLWSFSLGLDGIAKLKEQAKTPYASNYQNYFTLAEWINSNTPENSITAVRKEGLFYLFSRKHVKGYEKTLDREAQIEHLKRKGVDYVVVEQLGYSTTSKYLVPTIDRYPNKFKIIKELKNPNTYLMQFLPELGYWGEWENEKRNGKGTYVWEDGQKYVGYWKDDLRHGVGTVFFANGEQLDGIWKKGKLNSTAIKKDKNGNVIEQSLYENNLKVKVVYEAN